MFVIFSYDVGEKRVGKVGKIAKKYLWQVHKSLYSGHLTERQLEKLKYELKRYILPTEDSIYIYKTEYWNSLNIEQIGEIKETDFITL